MTRSYFCRLCERSDLPETEWIGADTTVRDHLRIWHPDEWATVDYDFATDRMMITPTGEHFDGYGSDADA